MRIDAGGLNRRATLLRPTEVRSAAGEVTLNYLTAGLRWVSFMALRPSEIDREQTPGSKAETKLLMRLDSLTALVGVRWRVAVDGTEYNVIGTEPTPADGSLIVFVAGVQA